MRSSVRVKKSVCHRENGLEGGRRRYSWTRNRVALGEEEEGTRRALRLWQTMNVANYSSYIRSLKTRRTAPKKYCRQFKYKILYQSALHLEYMFNI